MIYKYLVWRGLEKHPGVTSYYRAVHNLGCWTLKETGLFPIWNSNWFKDVFFFNKKIWITCTVSKSFPASYSGLQFNRFPKLALNTVFPRPWAKNKEKSTNFLNILNLVKQRKRKEKSTFFLNSCSLVATWSTSTEKSEPSPRPQYIRPEVIWNFKRQISRALVFFYIICSMMFSSPVICICVSLNGIASGKTRPWLFIHS